LEVSDLLKKKKHPLISLTDADHSFSFLENEELQSKFLKGIPFAYLQGEVEFCSVHFKVNESTLIPRPETEYLVDLLIRKNKKYLKAVDVGTGSGVILLSLMKNGVVKEGWGIDLSSQALEVTRENAWRLALSPKLIENDRLGGVNEKFDLIISNPPYIKKNLHRQLVQKTVDEFEPEISLYLEDAIYEKWFLEFFLQVKKCLKSQGEFIMEGHELELINQVELLQELGFIEVELKKDLSGADRFIFAKNP